ncbi:GNAT family N-acetyltransferase [Pseudoroseicyclus tamaricis]|uniref:GNAT family N-acetyltransferase n=1 Tax=Pseudoroseicyclus tamaricis TaxID=2705421 RepID=A0A6B2JVM9_9RHOB|nr:GNAT family N-acetyltransferase [Pseudoroseicyclus tamaricis]NDV01955.1 GNAT family N-acetyltransferase [Pseudoroseicyclus tamaricis]
MTEAPAITLRRVSPREPGAEALLNESQALMRAMFEQNHFLSHDALAAPHIHLYLAEAGSQPLGTGALAIFEGYGEIKSLYTSEAARGRGVAAALLARLEEVARAASLPWLRLETGPGLDSAQRLYRRFGYTLCGPYGAYKESPSSIFYEKALT